MKTPQGRWIGLTAHRKMICDFLYFAKRVPSVPVQRRMQLGVLSAARAQAAVRPSWCILFSKAFSIVAETNPLFRTSYLEFPWARLYEHPISVGSIAVERATARAQEPVFAKLRGPELHRLGALNRYLARFVGSQSKDIPLARLGRWLSLLPWPIRYLAWWSGLNLDGFFKAEQFGTFCVSVYSSLGAESLHPITPLSYLLNYGVIGQDGSVDVRIVYDHRVLDGAMVARCLADMEIVLNTTIADELCCCSQPKWKAAG